MVTEEALSYTLNDTLKNVFFEPIVGTERQKVMCWFNGHAQLLRI